MIPQTKNRTEFLIPSRRQFIKGAGSAAVAVLSAQLLGMTRKSGAERPVVGSGEHQFEVIHDWGKLPKHIRYGNTHGICEDSQGNIYVHHSVHSSSDVPDSLVIFDSEGRFVGSWGKEYQGSAHGLHLQREGSEEFLYLSARDYKDLDRNIVAKTTLKGEVVLSLGYPKESEHYKQDAEGRPLTKYHPTNLAIAPNGDIYGRTVMVPAISTSTIVRVGSSGALAVRGQDQDSSQALTESPSILVVGQRFCWWPIAPTTDSSTSL